MKAQQENLRRRLIAIRSRNRPSIYEQIGRQIAEEFWHRKTSEWQLEEQQMLMAMQGLREASPDSLLNAKRTLELRE